MDKGSDWLSQLTTADGEQLQFDPSLLEDDKERSGCSSEAEYDVDAAVGGGDLYDELGRTPPRMSLMRNRKWSADKKHSREMEKRGILKKSSGPRTGPGGRGTSPRRGPGPPKYTSRKGMKKINYARDLIEGPWDDSVGEFCRKFHQNPVT